MVYCVQRFKLLLNNWPIFFEKKRYHRPCARCHMNWQICSCFQTESHAFWAGGLISNCGEATPKDFHSYGLANNISQFINIRPGDLYQIGWPRFGQWHAGFIAGAAKGIFPHRIVNLEKAIIGKNVKQMAYSRFIVWIWIRTCFWWVEV